MKKKNKKKNNNNKKSHIVSLEYAGLNQTNYSVQTFECSCLLLQRIVHDQMEEKLSNKLPAPILKDFRLENIDCTNYQLIFMTAEEILSKTFFSC